MDGSLPELSLFLSDYKTKQLLEVSKVHSWRRRKSSSEMFFGGVGREVHLIGRGSRI